MNIQKIADRTMLCLLNKGMWRPMKFHRRETSAENARHNTNAARVLVRITEHKALTNIEKLHGEAYREHCKLTLPTIQEGSRLIPVTRQFEHSQRMKDYATGIGTQVTAFLGDYDTEKAQAPVRLNGLYDSTMWPDRRIVEAKFYFVTRYLTCPTDGAWAEWLAESARAAEDDLKDRMTEVLRSIVAGCNSNLHRGTFDKLRGLLAVLPDLNLTDDDMLSQVASYAAPIAAIDVDTLRDSKPHRQRTADAAQRMVDMLGRQ